jgi:hypothetical protein
MVMAQYVFVFVRIVLELNGCTTAKYRSSDIRTSVYTLA